MKRSLQKLLRVMPPPRQPIYNTGDWSVVESECGTRLPNDYKEYIERYGAGQVGGFINPYAPFHPKPRRAWWQEAKSCLKSYRALRRDHPVDFSLPPHPEKGGLLPWAYTDDGDDLFWQTQEKPDSWTVVVLRRQISVDQPPLVPLSLSMTEFLLAYLTRNLDDGILNQHWLNKTGPIFRNA